MHKYSRVERYKELRKNISAMDKYSFEDTLSKKESAEKSTLSLSVDAILKEQEEKKKEENVKKIKKRYHKNKNTNLKMIALIVFLSVIFVAIFIIFILVLVGVI